MGVIGYFSDILDGTLNFKRKPCPDALNWLIAERGLDRSKTLMVGDRDIDIEAGHNAGIDGCLLDPGAYYPDTSAEFKVLKLEDIIQIL